MKLYYEKSELPAATTLAMSTIDEEIKLGRFPQPRQVSAKKVAWLVREVEEWAQALPVITEVPKFARAETELYRHFDAAGRLLYVGISLSTVHRLANHMKGSRWADQIATITIERHDTREAALAAERAAIQRELPLHNIMHAGPSEPPPTEYLKATQPGEHPLRAYFRDRGYE